MLHRLLLAGAFAGLTFAAAQAADVEAPPPESFDWSGFYVGAQVGYGWGDFDIKITTGDLDAEPPFPNGDFDGVLGGAHAGYNFQADQFVFGLEADIEASDMDGSDTWGQEVEDVDVEVLGSLRARAGIALDNLLLYATGGLAGAEIKYTTDIIPGSTSNNNVDYWGYAVGGGVEYAFSESLSVRLEYRYTDLGEETFNPKSIECFPIDCKLHGDVDFHAVRAGISWHFGAL